MTDPRDQSAHPEPSDQPDFPIRPPALLRTLIVGAGRAGRALARDLSADADSGLRPIGFIDDAPARPDPPLPPRLPLPHLGALDDLAHLVTDHHAEAVVLAIPRLPATRTRELVRAAVGAGAVVRYLPWYAATLCRDVTPSDLHALDIRALIDGPEPYVASTDAKEVVTGKRVLLTGATTPLGAELCRQLPAFNPGDLHLLDAAQLADRDRTDHTFRDLRPEVVFHTAGLRNASVLERRPSLGVIANIEATDNLARAASRHGTERFILISSETHDAHHASMLSATHRVAEAVVRNAAHKKRTKTVFASVRIGDVHDARDSLLTVLADQIRAGGPVTITHPESARCFATAEEAVGLALEAAQMATGGEIYVLDVGEPVRITDVVSRFTTQYKLPAVPIRYVGAGQVAQVAQVAPRETPRSPEPRLPTTHPQIFTTAPAPEAEHGDHAEPRPLHERLDKLYNAAAKNRDPKVRQMLGKLAAESTSRHPD